MWLTSYTFGLDHSRDKIKYNLKYLTYYQALKIYLLLAVKFQPSGERKRKEAMLGEMRGYQGSRVLSQTELDDLKGCEYGNSETL